MAQLSARTKLLGGLAVVAAIIAAVAVAMSLRSDDSSPPTASNDQPVAAGSAVVQSGVSSPVAAATTASLEPSISPTTPTDTANRRLDAVGAFTCSAPGLWRPFAGVPVAIKVGEAVAPASCSVDVVAVPPGFCSAQPCAEVPVEWQIRLMNGQAAQRVFLLVVPVQAPNALFYCVIDAVMSPARELDNTVPIEEACPLGPLPPVAPPPADTTDIPYVPPVSFDIPTAPPASADIVSG